MTHQGSGSGTGAPDDIKAKMREALERKQAANHPDDSAENDGVVHGSEVRNRNVGPSMHRRKAGGGGS